MNFLMAASLLTIYDPTFLPPLTLSQQGMNENTTERWSHTAVPHESS
ncbi:MAG: hypothetical protein HYX73_00725 [Acidobacteria bacterium]|nr:hypothetical protein [Acidobacteriota bacterium]